MAFKEISELDPYSVLDPLPDITKESIKNSIENNVDPLVIAERMAQEPGMGLEAKGGSRWRSEWYQQLKIRVIEFICEDRDEHSELKKRIVNKGKITGRDLVTAVTGYVAAKVGISAAICVPFVALILYAALRLGIDSWCDLMQKPQDPA